MKRCIVIALGLAEHRSIVPSKGEKMLLQIPVSNGHHSSLYFPLSYNYPQFWMKWLMPKRLCKNRNPSKAKKLRKKKVNFAISFQEYLFNWETTHTKKGLEHFSLFRCTCKFMCNRTHSQFAEEWRVAPVERVIVALFVISCVLKNVFFLHLSVWKYFWHVSSQGNKKFHWL